MQTKALPSVVADDLEQQLCLLGRPSPFLDLEPAALQLLHRPPASVWPWPCPLRWGPFTRSRCFSGEGEAGGRGAHLPGVLRCKVQRFIPRTNLGRLYP